MEKLTFKFVREVYISWLTCKPKSKQRKFFLFLVGWLKTFIS